MVFKWGGLISEVVVKWVSTVIENVKLRQIIAKNNFPGIFQQKENFSENLTSGCHGNTFVGVTSKSTNLAKITLWSHDNSDKI